jgi:hypothetical protein
VRVATFYDLPGIPVLQPILVYNRQLEGLEQRWEELFLKGSATQNREEVDRQLRQVIFDINAVLLKPFPFPSPIASFN